jgi:hypothetical protein
MNFKFSGNKYEIALLENVGWLDELMMSIRRPTHWLFDPCMHTPTTDGHGING